MLSCSMKGRRKGQRGHGISRMRTKNNGWLEQGRCTLLMKVDCWV